jgi:hypothetical protein
MTCSFDAVAGAHRIGEALAVLNSPCVAMNVSRPVAVIDSRSTNTGISDPNRYATAIHSCIHSEVVYGHL